MNPTYEDLQDQLIEWLRPKRFTLNDLKPYDFEEELQKQLDIIVPTDKAFVLAVALSDNKLCVATNAEPYQDATDLIKDNIFYNLYKFGWDFYRQAQRDLEATSQKEEENGSV